MHQTTTCPTCGEKADAKGQNRPFCSQRCKMIDLSKWLGGEFIIPGPSGEFIDTGDDEPQ